MSPWQFEQFEKLINNTQEGQLDVFMVLKQDNIEVNVFKELLFQYRSNCIQQILRKYQNVNTDEADFCFFRGVNSLLRSINEQRFVFKNEKSIPSYLFIACEGQVKRFLGQKKVNILPFSVNEYLLNRSSENEDGLMDKIVKENKFKSIRQALSEITEDCKQQIQKYYLNNMSHAQIIEDMPALKNEKNSSAKLNRCLKKLRSKAREYLKKLELQSEN